MPWLINAAQLDKFRKSQKNVVVLDASWYLDDAGRDAKQEFIAKHIDGARFLDLNDFADKSNPLPNMLLRDENLIKEKMGSLGITNDHKIIIYDNSPLHTSCRALWMFKVFGHNPYLLYILDGGLRGWEFNEGKVESGEAKTATPKAYNVTFKSHLVRTLVQMKTNMRHPAEQVIDVRHPVRYAGGPEHRPSLRPGHIPGSYCFPFMTMFEIDGTWKPIDRIRKQLTGIGVELQYPIVSTCGSGITSAVLNFALDLMGQEQNAIYDGSWSEWGAKTLYPGENDLDERPVITSLDK
jgi:thiosulfate/3-mercaptopyruvate sulfurtransferase